MIMIKWFFLSVLTILGGVLFISMTNCLLSGTIYQETERDKDELPRYSEANIAFQKSELPDSKIHHYEGITPKSGTGKYYEYAGAVHVHTTFSDGGGTYEEIGQVADSLGLDFIIPSDHNYIKSLKDVPLKKVGHTLIVPGVEMTPHKEFGHFLVMGDSIPPIPSGSVSPDSTFRTSLRMGDMIFPAHPFHPSKKNNYWKDWNLSFTGFELFNLDENWRKSFTFSRINRILGGFIVFFFRDDALNYVLSYPLKEMEEFDTLNKTRKVVGIGSTDAHSRLLINKGLFFRYPSYRSMFKQVQTVIVTREQFNGIYGHDRGILLKALHQGNSFVALSGLEDARGFLFSAVSDSKEASLGDSLRMGREAKLRVDVPDDDRSAIQIMKDGVLVGEYHNKSSIDLTITDPGSYRVQVFQERRMLPFFRKRSFPWILSNAIYLYR
jgi:hypothetical protein